MDDLVAFNVFHTRNSPSLRKMRRRAIVNIAVFMFLLLFGVAQGLTAPFGSALLTAIIGAATAAGYVFLFQKTRFVPRIRKVVQAVFSDDNNPGLIGEHTLEVDEEGFTHTTRVCTSRYSWGGLVRVESEPGYTYLYTGAQSAHVIPHAAITSGNFRAVLEQIKQHYHPEAALSDPTLRSIGQA